MKNTLLAKKARSETIRYMIRDIYNNIRENLYYHRSKYNYISREDLDPVILNTIIMQLRADGYTVVESEPSYGNKINILISW